MTYSPESPWIAEREATVCTWKVDYNRGYISNMATSLLVDFISMSDRQLTQYVRMMKACGFRSGSIILWHCLRMLLVLLISAVLAALLSTPATKLLITPIFRRMGADRVDFLINPLENFVFYPLLLVCGTSAAVFLMALSTRRISASQTSSIE